MYFLLELKGMKKLLLLLLLSEKIKINAINFDKLVKLNKEQTQKEQQTRNVILAIYDCSSLN